LLNTQMKICRGSGVLVKIDGEWKIKHYVLSMTFEWKCECYQNQRAIEDKLRITIRQIIAKYFSITWFSAGYDVFGLIFLCRVRLINFLNFAKIFQNRGKQKNKGSGKWNIY
jgi:hypothetical protein